MAWAHLACYFILSSAYDIGQGKISTPGLLLTQRGEGENGVHFCVENQEIKFPGLISPEFEFM